jgi:hypothetical protein
VSNKLCKWCHGFHLQIHCPTKESRALVIFGSYFGHRRALLSACMPDPTRIVMFLTSTLVSAVLMISHCVYPMRPGKGSGFENYKRGCSYLPIFGCKYP